MVKQYCLREGYIQRDRALTFEGEAVGSYWTPWRIRQAGLFQYEVYAFCRDWMMAHGLRSVMDVGCGYPIKVRELLVPQGFSVVLVDQPSLSGIMAAEFAELAFLPVDLEKMAVTLDQRFEVILCADVLEHLLDPDPCLAFIRDHLTPDGVAIFSTPERDGLRGRDCLSSPKAEHVREWSREEFARYLVGGGFSIVRHELLPHQRLAVWERGVRWLLRGRIWRARWSSCQMVVTRPVCSPTIA